MRRLLAFILAFTMLSGTIAFAEENELKPKYTERKSEQDEAWLWNELSKHSPNDYITAGVLSYFWRESQYRSDSVTGWATLLAQDNFDLCGYVGEKTNAGLSDGSSRDFFIEAIHSCGGFGLGQWYSIHYLETLYDFASKYGTTIGDARMQCEFIFWSLKQNESLWEDLLACTNARKAGQLIGIFYDGTEDGWHYMGNVANNLYDEYGKEKIFDECCTSFAMYWRTHPRREYWYPIRMV